MTETRCPTCRQLATYMLKAERWRCLCCPRWLDAPKPPVAVIGQGEWAREIK